MTRKDNQKDNQIEKLPKNIFLIGKQYVVIKKFKKKEYTVLFKS